jgi:hypothetical protein
VETAPRTPKDLIGRPTTFLFWWGLPLAIGFSAAFLHSSLGIWAWVVALAWMGVGCALNAVRCRRLHCYVSAPVFCLGAATLAAIALGVGPLGSDAVTYIVDGALGVAIISWSLEAVFGKYLARR